MKRFLIVTSILLVLLLALSMVGCTGKTGATGATGQQGSEGPVGSQGIQGEQGEQGATGPAGLAGVKGATGDQGATGPAGAKGEQGIQGEQGSAGPAGVGASGPRGRAGPQGPQGIPGISGYEFIISPPMYFSSGGWAGWSAPEGKVVLGGGVFGVATRISCPAFPNSVWPHYTYGANEYGWVAQSAEAGTGYIYVICIDATNPEVTDLRSPNYQLKRSAGCSPVPVLERR